MAERRLSLERCYLWEAVAAVVALQLGGTAADAALLLLWTGAAFLHGFAGKF